MNKNILVGFYLPMKDAYKLMAICSFNETQAYAYLADLSFSKEKNREEVIRAIRHEFSSLNCVEDAPLTQYIGRKNALIRKKQGGKFTPEISSRIKDYLRMKISGR